MKKVISVILISLFCAVSSISASADLDLKTAPSFTVYYESSGAGSTVPTETLEFSSVPAQSNPANGNISFGTQTRSGAEITVPILLTVNYSIPGIYSYTITQTEGSTLGVSYDTKPIVFCVLVGYDEENGGQIKVLQTGAGKDEDSGMKKTGFTNTCNYSHGTLQIMNTVNGNTGDRNKEFTINVSFTAPENKSIADVITYSEPETGTPKEISVESWKIPEGGSARTVSVTVKLKNAQTVTFSNVPAGVMYTVSQTREDGYTLEYEGENGTISADTPASAKFTNSSSGSLGTGIFFKRMPYIIILALGIIGLVLLLRGKRKRDF